MKQNLRKPENWQDFETLCKKLWGEIWNCPEIKKNGRSGQNQKGVDVYGIPQGFENYFGIQCKGKDDYSKSQLTKKEIDQEIEKAKLFIPSLEKFYFATTANKDSKIEEYIRVKDLENRKQNLFQIHLFSWEDIVDLIDENKSTHDWYLKKVDFRSLFSVKISFQNDLSEIYFEPALLENHITYFKKEIDFDNIPQMGSLKTLQIPGFDRKEYIKSAQEVQPVEHYFRGRSSKNLSSSVFALRVLNNGSKQIENFKLYFEIQSDDVIVDTVYKQTHFLDVTKYSYDTFFYEGSKEGIFEPDSKILVQTDSILSDDIAIRPLISGEQTVTLKWNLVSKDFNDEGFLYIFIKPDITVENTEMHVENFYDMPEKEIILENIHL